jgi:hypothetical protein
MKLAKLLQLQWDRAAAVVCVLVGGLILVIGWFGASGTLDPGVQLPYIMSGGVGGVFFLGLGATLWLSSDLRDEWCKLDAIDETLKALGETPNFDVRTLVSVADPTPNGAPAAVASQGRAR